MFTGLSWAFLEQLVNIEKEANSEIVAKAARHVSEVLRKFFFIIFSSFFYYLYYTILVVKIPNLLVVRKKKL